MTDDEVEGTSRRASAGRSRSGRPSARPTIFDVAEAAGVSYSTVSRVVNGLPNIRAETRERVEAAMHDLGYVAHISARALATGRSNQIGLLVQQVEDAFFLSVIAGVDRAVMEAGYDLLLCTTHDRREKETSYVARLTHGMVDGLLVLMPRSLPDWLPGNVAGATPIVLIDHDGEAPGADVVNAANLEGATAGVCHLTALGHRRIGIVTGAMETGSTHLRIQGWRDALALAGLPAPDELIAEGDYEEARGREAAHELLALPERPTAIFAANDRTAVGVLMAAAERGLRVPDDLSVLGFDDDPGAARTNPPLTTVRQPLRDMGRTGVEVLLRRMRDPDAPPERVTLPTQLVVRGSTGPAPARGSAEAPTPARSRGRRGQA
ncbi:MAG: LacI family DNA-binding transcriptional regulator [Chloroflexota bacterium]